MANKKEGKEYLWNGTTTKSQIIEILAQGRVNLKTIHAKLAEKNRILKIHAVYAQLLALIKKGWVQQDHDLYQLNYSWLNGMLTFFQEAYKNTNTKEESESKNIPANVITFPNLSSCDKFLMDFENTMINGLPKDQKSFVTWAWATNHSWWNIFYLQKQHETLKRYKNLGIELFSVFCGDTPLDRWNAKVYQNCGMQAETGKQLFFHDIGIYNDHVLSLIMPLELKNDLHTMFHTTKSLEELDIQHFLNKILEQKLNPPIQLLIYQDEQLAKNVLEKILGAFAKKPKSSDA